uniref:UBA domain-containing protein n=1 Tax=Heterorhabditis bacteriophora TaxID=37862 RepID=A0A1I7W8C4_HETBA
MSLNFLLSLGFKKASKITQLTSQTGGGGRALRQSPGS